MLTEKDLKQIAAYGISEAQVNHQIAQIKAGFPFLKIESVAAVGNGILAPSTDDCEKYIDAWNRYKSGTHRIVKFVPASGAASRMFKDLFAFLNADYNVPTTDFEKQFLGHIREFAFRKELCGQCKRNVKKNVCTLLEEGNYKEIVAELLEAKGLDYGNLPKGLLLFHNYEDGPRTPMEEHLVEAALYATSGGEANVHFTVSHDHLKLFEQKVIEKVDTYSRRFGVRYHISFSEQKPSTDTIAVNLDDTSFRDNDGSLVFRPGGHGALIENLNEIDADVIFIKNIDNVVPDRLKDETVRYKQVIAGILIECQKQTFAYLNQLESGTVTRRQLEEILLFTEQTLCCRKADARTLTDEQLADYLRAKLNRPMRVCGVVKNVGEPGGGPFLTYNQDGSVSPQILESSQIDKTNSTYVKMFAESTHFNPVDLVCAVKDYHGVPFRLPDYVDRQTGFISRKSKNGRDLKALELPGLWNGAMSNWNTIFVEVPLSTFNPVKTVNDLLREQHQ